MHWLPPSREIIGAEDAAEEQYGSTEVRLLSRFPFSCFVGVASDMTLVGIGRYIAFCKGSSQLLGSRVTGQVQFSRQHRARLIGYATEFISALILGTNRRFAGQYLFGAFTIFLIVQQ